MAASAATDTSPAVSSPSRRRCYFSLLPHCAHIRQPTGYSATSLLRFLGPWYSSTNADATESVHQPQTPAYGFNQGLTAAYTDTTRTDILVLVHNEPY